MNEIDIGTFGNSPAAITLAGILAKDENKKCLSKISRLLQHFGEMLNELSNMDTRVSVGMEQIIYLHFLSKCERFPKEVKTFTRNLIAMKHRVWIVNNDGSLPKKTRIKQQNSSE